MSLTGWRLLGNILQRVIFFVFVDKGEVVVVLVLVVVLCIC